MRSRSAAAVLGVVLLSAAPVSHRTPDLLQANRNTERAGSLRDGVLTIALEAKESAWRLNGATRPPMTIEAFSEVGKAPLMPGPLVRAPQGTEIHLSVRNSLRTPLTFFVPVAMRGVPDRFSQDSMVIAPGAVGTLTTRATTPGNYIYGAKLPNAASQRLFIGGVLAGAIVIDTAGTSARARDRVFMIMMTPDSLRVAGADRSDPVAGDVG